MNLGGSVGRIANNTFNPVQQTKNISSTWTGGGTVVDRAKRVLTGKDDPTGITPGIFEGLNGLVGKGVSELKDGAGSIKEQTGLSNEQGKKIQRDIRGSITNEYTGLRGIADTMVQADQQHLGNLRGIGSQYLESLGASETENRNRLNQLSSQAAQQAKDGQTTYDNAIRPNMLNAIDQTNKELYDTKGNPNYMTLQQAQDPNNAVSQSFRNFYNNQAQGEGKTGLADVGIMQQLGAQATAQQMGGMGGAPMTGAQMQMLMAQNQSQAGQAMANVQKRQQSLKDQGIAQGWLQSQAAYDRGQGVLARQQSNLSGLQNAQGMNMAQQQGLRGEQNQYGGLINESNNRVSGQTAEVNSGLSTLQNQMATGDLQRRAGLLSGEAGANRAMDVGDLVASNAQQQGRLGTLSALSGGGAGALLGAMLGGGAGAQAGSYMGGGFLNSAYGGQQPNYAQAGGGGMGAAGAAQMFGYGQQQPQQPYYQNTPNPYPTAYGPQQPAPAPQQQAGGLSGILGMLGNMG